MVEIIINDYKKKLIAEMSEMKYLLGVAVWNHKKLEGLYPRLMVSHMRATIERDTGEYV